MVNVKKILLLFIALARYEAVEEYKEVRNFVDLWKASKLNLPKTTT